MQLKVSNSDIPVDKIFFDMLKEKLKSYENFYEREGVYMQMLNLLESKLLDLEKKSEDTTEVKKEIILISIELFKKYIEEKKIDDANSLLDKLKKYDDDIINKEYKLYTDKNFLSHISLSKLDLSKKYLELLEKNKEDSERFSKLKNQLEKVYSDDTDIVHNELQTVKKKMVKYEEKVENLVQIFTTYIDDKEILNKVDTVSKDISTKIDTNTNKLTKKLDEVKIAIIKTNNQKLNSFLENIYKSNQALASKIQMMYDQNDRVNRKAKDVLNNSIQSMNNEISTLLDRPIVSSTNNNTQEIKDIVEACNWRFYKGIQGLCEKESDSYNRKLLEMSIAFTKREHELHIENLEKSHDIEILEIKKEADKLNSKRLTHISEQIDKSYQKLDSISKQIDRNYRQSLDNLIKIVQDNNQKLINEIKEISPNEMSKIESILDNNKREIKNIVQFPIEHVKKVVEICNNSLYSKIQTLYQDFSKKELLDMALDLTREENEKAIQKYKDEIEKIKQEQIEWEKGLDNRYKAKTNQACKELLNLTAHKHVKVLEKNIKKKLDKKEIALNEFIEEKNSEEIAKKKREEEHDKFMQKIRLRAELKPKIDDLKTKFFRFKIDNIKLEKEIIQLEKEIENSAQDSHFKKIDELNYELIELKNRTSVEELQEEDTSLYIFGIIILLLLLISFIVLNINL